MVADLAERYGLLPPYESKVTLGTLADLIAGLGEGSRLWVAMFANAGRSFGDVVTAMVYNQMLMALWDGKGKKPHLIDLDPPNTKKAQTEHYGVAVTTAELIELMGDHIPRG